MTATNYFEDNCTAAQRKRLIDALQVGPITTIEARKNLDIMMPASRIKELREIGYTIDTLWTQQETEAGQIHRVALYVLQKEVAHG